MAEFKVTIETEGDFCEDDLREALIDGIDNVGNFEVPENFTVQRILHPKQQQLPSDEEIDILLKNLHIVSKDEARKVVAKWLRDKYQPKEVEVDWEMLKSMIKREHNKYCRKAIHNRNDEEVDWLRIAIKRFKQLNT